MKYIYFGSDNFSLSILEGICKKQKPIAIVTQPDRASGRKQKLQSPPLAIFAKENNIPLYQPESLKKEEAQQPIIDLGADLFIVVSFGQILTQSFLDKSPAIINGHASLLPKLRGASPIQSSIIQGHVNMGMSIMHIVKALDAGPVIQMDEFPLDPKETGGSLTNKLSKLAIKQFEQILALEKVPAGTEQNHDEATHCGKILKPDMRLKTESQTVVELDRWIRALSPYPGAYLILNSKKGELRLKIYKTEFCDFRGNPNSIFQDGKDLYLNGYDQSQSLKLLSIQVQGKAAMDPSAFLNGWNMQFEADIVIPQDA